MLVMSRTTSLSLPRRVTRASLVVAVGVSVEVGSVAVGVAVVAGLDGEADGAFPVAGTEPQAAASTAVIASNRIQLAVLIISTRSLIPISPRAAKRRALT